MKRNNLFTELLASLSAPKDALIAYYNKIKMIRPQMTGTKYSLS